MHGGGADLLQHWGCWTIGAVQYCNRLAVQWALAQYSGYTMQYSVGITEDSWPLVLYSVAGCMYCPWHPYEAHGAAVSRDVLSRNCYPCV